MSAGNYPLSTGVAYQSCVVSGGYVYCVGGATGGTTLTTAVYYASLPPNGGVVSWNPAASSSYYPYPIMDQSCVVNAADIYCISGSSTASVFNPADVFYAPLSSPFGVKGWSSTTSTSSAGPAGTIDITGQSCAVSEGYVYCVGGGTATNVEVASLSSSGVGTWGYTVSYPIEIAGPTCVVSGGYLYCVGGDTPNPTDAVYYAQFWTPTSGTSGTPGFPVESIVLGIIVGIFFLAARRRTATRSTRVRKR
jgi:hypothetical protein